MRNNYEDLNLLDLPQVKPSLKTYFHYKVLCFFSTNLSSRIKFSSFVLEQLKVNITFAYLQWQVERIFVNIRIPLIQRVKKAVMFLVSDYTIKTLHFFPSCAIFNTFPKLIKLLTYVL